MLQHVGSARCENCNGALEWVGGYYHCDRCGRVPAHGSD
jgi:exosome complex RNA-binding protein Csl4